jgi:uncharacterized DUF497 family protein
MYKQPYIWDEDKNRINLRKHGITFEEAATVFKDSNAIIIEDETHSDYEERFIVIGISSESRLLVVCHCYRDNDSTIRLISARKANNKESDLYWR